MKKKFVGIFIGLCLAMAALTSCNKAVFDFERTFDKAMITIGSETVIVEIDKWTDYEGEQLQIWTKDDDILLVSSYNCVFIKEGDSAESIYKAAHAKNLEDYKD